MMKLLNKNPLFILQRTFSHPKTQYSQHNFVPRCAPSTEEDITSLHNFIDQSENMVVLTGAGISTESGIPDYRSAEVGLYARTNHQPVKYQEFLRSSSVRQRYWARNYIGWPKFSQTQPNLSHLALAKLEQVTDKVSAIVTQNVDGLHTKAGSSTVVELHGASFRVICLDCNVNYSRVSIQQQIKDLNQNFGATSDMIRPDGDIEISLDQISTFCPPHCDACGGILKPDIVFFGDNVPKPRVDLIRAYVSSSDLLLVLGTSLTVFSSYRIILQAVEEGKNVVILNIGPTRGDHLANLKISAQCGDVLPRICETFLN